MSSELEHARGELQAAVDFLDDVIILDGIADSVHNAAQCCLQVGGRAHGIAQELLVTETYLKESATNIAQKILEIRGMIEWINTMLGGGM